MSRRLGNYMPLYFDDFIGGTISFGADEIGGYILLLMHQWANESIESDPVIIERVARCEYGKLQRVLSKFDQIENGRLVNRKCQRVMEEREAYLKSRLGGAIKGGEANKRRILDSHKDTHKASHTDSHKGSPSSSSSSSSSDSPSLSTTTTSECGGSGSFEIKSGTKAHDVITALIACRPEYGRISRSAWENELKQTGATAGMIIEAANAFITADANRIESLSSPARYFGGILKKIVEETGTNTKSLAEQVADRKKRRAIEEGRK